MEVTYKEVRTIANRGAIEQAEDSDIFGLLVGDQLALKYDDNHSQYGYDAVRIYPAFYDGKRSWFKTERWYPGHGYSASGYQEIILSFEDGVKIFLERGVFSFPIPEEEE